MLHLTDCRFIVYRNEYPNEMLINFPKLFVAFYVFLHVKMKVATMFAKLPIYIARIW